MNRAVGDRPTVSRPTEEDLMQDIEALAGLLRETAEHHDTYEKASPPHDWWHWYAPYLAARLEGRTPEEAVASAGTHMEEVHGVIAR